MIRLLHLADLHLGWEPSYLSADKAAIRKKERDLLLKQAVDFALSPANKIQGVIIVGDLFERYNPDANLVRSVIGELNRITNAGLMLVTVPGNHDEITYRESVYREKADEWPGYLVKEPMPSHCLTHIIEGCPIHIYSLAYTGGLTKPGNITEFPKLAEPGFHIGAFHGSLDWEGLGDRSLPLTTDKLSKAGYDYVALGHYHQLISKPLKGGEGVAVYPGAIEFKSFHDPGTGIFTIVNWDGKKAKIETVPANVRPYRTLSIDISGIKDYESLLAACQKNADKDVMTELKLTGSPKFQVGVDRLVNDLWDTYFYVEVQSTASYFSEEYLEMVSKEPTLRGLFATRIQDKIKEAQDDKLLNLLEMVLVEGLAALEGSEK